jgi:hypothetical protein
MLVAPRDHVAAADAPGEVAGRHFGQDQHGEPFPGLLPQRGLIRAGARPQRRHERFGREQGKGLGHETGKKPSWSACR